MVMLVLKAMVLVLMFGCFITSSLLKLCIFWDFKKLKKFKIAFIFVKIPWKECQQIKRQK